jgi:hypothetical protein
LFGFVVGLRRKVLIVSGNLKLGHRPCGAAGDLVSDLHHIGHCAGVLEGFNRVVSVLLPRFLQAIDIQASPGDGNILVLRVGPGVGKVQIQKERGARCLDFLSQWDGVLK